MRARARTHAVRSQITQAENARAVRHDDLQQHQQQHWHSRKGPNKSRKQGKSANVSKVPQRPLSIASGKARVSFVPSDNFHVVARPVPHHCMHASSVCIAEVHSSGSAKECRESLTGLPDRGGVDDRGQFVNVVQQATVEQHFVAILQGDQVAVFLDVAGNVPITMLQRTGKTKKQKQKGGTTYNSQLSSHTPVFGSSAVEWSGCLPARARLAAGQARPFARGTEMLCMHEATERNGP